MITSTPPARPGSLDSVVAATIFLMSAYVRQGGSARLADMILRHLEQLADDGRASGMLAATCEQLADEWYVLRQRAAARAGRT